MTKFRTQSKGYKTGPLTVVPIELLSERRNHFSGVVVSVPSVVGSAVKRNRFRRMIRSYIVKNVAEHDVWIRLSPRHKLQDAVVVNQWRAWLDQGLRKALGRPCS